MKNEKSKLLLKFILFYVIGIAMVVIIFSRYTTNGTTTKAKQAYENLFAFNQSLNNDLLKLINLNQLYLQTLIFPISDSAANVLVADQKKLMDPITKGIENLRMQGKKYDGEIGEKYADLASYYQRALDTWEADNKVILAKGSPVAAPPAQDLPDLGKARDRQIILLEKSLQKERQKGKNYVAMLQKNESEIKFLKWALRSQVGTLRSLENRLKN